MVCFHSSYNLGDEHKFDKPDKMFIELSEVDTDIAEESHIKCLKDKAYQNNVILPLYLYDHSGITINTTGFSCPWDSGQVGYIYVSHKDIIKEYGKLDIDKATKLLESEVSEYDKMLTGDVYGIVSETYNKDKEQIDYDCCFGYFGYDYAIEALKTEIRHFIGENMVTTKEEKLKADYLGKVAVFKVGKSLEFNVKIIDTRITYGHNEFKIQPVSGSTGAQWVRNNGKLVI